MKTSFNWSLNWHKIAREGIPSKKGISNKGSQQTMEPKEFQKLNEQRAQVGCVLHKRDPSIWEAE